MLASQGVIERSPRIGTTIVGGMVRIPLNPIPGRHQPEGMTVERLEDRIVPSIPLIRERLRTDAARVGMIEHIYSFRGIRLGVRVGYYSDNNEDAVEMMLALDPSTGRALPGRDEIRIDG